ncbi:MAG TPA: hypothetical protein VG943_09850 [Caulobacterales bacterium]|nr:hypothetical protein [Caulobacterales bacterium]
MSEADVVAQLVSFTDILLAGVSVYFTIVSAYVAGLNYFVGRANWAGRLAAFFFFSFVMGVLIVVLVGARRTQLGLIARLQELQAAGDLTAAGRAILNNATQSVPGLESLHIWRESASIDGLVVSGLWGGFALTYVGVFALTFLFRWRDARPANG